MPTNTKTDTFLTPPPNPLGAEHVDHENGRPTWIPDRPGGRWHTIRAYVQLPERGRSPERIIVQDRVFTRNPEDSPTRDSFVGAPVNLNPQPIAPWGFPFARVHARPGLDPRSRKGRPSWADRNPQFPIYVAWARDVAGVTLDDLAAILGQGQGAVPPLAAQGRGLLASWGVLPWAVFPQGNPPIDWPNDPKFDRAVRAWALEADQIAAGKTLAPIVSAA